MGEIRRNRLELQGHGSVSLEKMFRMHQRIYIFNRRYFRYSEKFTPNGAYSGVKVEDRGDSGLWKTGYTYLSAICKHSLLALAEVSCHDAW